MSTIVIASRAGVVEKIVERLRVDAEDEQLSFAFAEVELADDEVRFVCVEERPVQRSEFLHQSWCHLELGDEARVDIMRAAHQRQAALVEFHSHTFDAPACFSPSDWSGFEEFVPYAWWRLRRPYAAVVVGPNSVDALAWPDKPDVHHPVTTVAGMRTTMLSHRRLGGLG